MFVRQAAGLGNVVSMFERKTDEFSLRLAREMKEKPANFLSSWFGNERKTGEFSLRLA